MSIGSIGSSALNSLLKTAARIQSINHDGSISDEAKRKMIAPLAKANSGLLESAQQEDEASKRATLVSSASSTDDAPSTDQVPAGAVEGVKATGEARSAGDTPKPVPPPLSRGSMIDKVG